MVVIYQAQQFSIDSDGNGRFGGVVSGSSIVGGQINIGNGNFTVDNLGFMSKIRLKVLVVQL